MAGLGRDQQRDLTRAVAVLRHDAGPPAVSDHPIGHIMFLLHAANLSSRWMRPKDTRYQNSMLEDLSETLEVDSTFKVAH